jgi:hypothetical protein
MIAAPETASAQGGWCARMLGGGENCGFATFGQCQAALSGNGGACVPNPRARDSGPAARGRDFGPSRDVENWRARAAEQARARRQFELERRLEQERRRTPPATAHKAAPPVATTRPAAATPATPAPPVTTAAAGNIKVVDLDTHATPNLSREGIRRVQIALKGKGFDPGPINGIASTRFQAAVQNFQTSYGIEVRGVVDNQTLLALGETDLTGQ